MSNRFSFETKGIGDLLRAGRLSVPPNQRPYAWGKIHVRNFMEDLNDAINTGHEDYFLGTVVLIQDGDVVPSIADGQQRIATTSILLARIRDALHSLGRKGSASSIDTDYLRKIDIETENTVSRLSLNLEDNEYFANTVLPGPMDDAVLSDERAARASNRRLREASEDIAEFLSVGLSQQSEASKASYLLRWVAYIKERAGVVVVTVPDEIGAYRMFETLNDRGLKASQADILKNYIFSKAGMRLQEATSSWSTISSVVENLEGDENDRLVTYLRHLWITKNGPTKERELAASIRSTVTSEMRAMSYVTDACNAVQDYVALWSSDHPTWQKYPPSVRNNVEVMSSHLQVEQIRPLMFAVSRHFSLSETEKAFRLFVSWSVRFLIFGGRGGMLDTQYSLRAQDVGTLKITKASELRDAMKTYVPSDAEFEQAFKSARVSRAHLARYYLRSLEKAMKNEPQPEYVANENTSEINLEHIMPLTTNSDWLVGADDARAAQKRIGNMVLLKADENRDLGNCGFSAKKATFSASSYITTKTVSDFEEWGLQQIEERQANLAALAVKAWPLTFA